MNAASSPFPLKPDHTPSPAEYPTRVFISLVNEPTPHPLAQLSSNQQPSSTGSPSYNFLMPRDQTHIS